MKKELNVSFTPQLLMHLLSLGNKFEQRTPQWIQLLLLVLCLYLLTQTFSTYLRLG